VSVNRSAAARSAPDPRTARIISEVDPDTGYIVTKRVNKRTGEEVGPSPTYHLMKADAGFDPPPSVALEAEVTLRPRPYVPTS
jgi:hypothetical protein